MSFLGMFTHRHTHKHTYTYIHTYIHTYKYNYRISNIHKYIYIYKTYLCVGVYLFMHRLYKCISTYSIESVSVGLQGRRVGFFAPLALDSRFEGTSRDIGQASKPAAGGM